jgi:virulence-associated protein VapD
MEKPVVDLDYINKRISEEVCHDTIGKLTENNLLSEYKECKSVKTGIADLIEILEKHGVESVKIELIINEYLLKLIPAGTKGVVKGNLFNKIVKNTIENMKFDPKRFEICFEKHCTLMEVSEKPDWYIIDKTNSKFIIGMNQLDLWGGGAQVNRGSKYIIDNKVNDKGKLLCVVCNEIKFNPKNKTNKTYKLFEIGYTNDTLCYIKNMEKIINRYFN